MKGIAVFLAALLLLMPAVSALATQDLVDTLELTAFDPPLPMDESWTIGDTERGPDPTLPPGYSVGDLWQDDLLYFAVYRDDGNGGQEILFLTDANREYPDYINYVPESFKHSGQKILYFIMISGAASRYLLYGYDMAENRLYPALSGCSVNMVFPEDLPAGYEGLGFLLVQDSIAAFNAETGEIVESVSIADLGGLPEIDGSFNGGSLQGGVWKYTNLTAKENGQIQISTNVMDYNNGTLRKSLFLYDAATKQIVDRWEKDRQF